MLTIRQHIKIIKEYLKNGDVNNAVKWHDTLCTIAKTPIERKLVHDLGNELQIAIFKHYEQGQ